jgi:hypothetical protein
LLDYLWATSGSAELSFGCNGNQCSSPVTDNNIFRLLNDASISWKVYAQSYLNAGGTVTTPDSARGTHYYRRHNGAVWFSDILSNTLGSQGGIVDFEHSLSMQQMGRCRGSQSSLRMGITMRMMGPLLPLMRS